MTINEAREQLSVLQKKIKAINHASGLIYYDGVTYAPPETAANRGQTLSILSENLYMLSTGKETGELLDFLNENKEELSQSEKRMTELMLKGLTELRKIPMDEYIEYDKLINEAQDVWHRAKDKSDYAMFEPYLNKIVKALIKFADYIKPGVNVYDVWLDKYEEGLTREKCDEFFGELKKTVVPLVKKISEAEQPDTKIREATYPIETQKKLSDYLMEVMKIDRNHCTIATTEHPFTIDFSKYDVRITTHYHENDMLSSLYSVVHEGGHALYELGVADEYAYTCLGSGVSMGIHESQSRFYENLIGRSREYINYIFPKLCELFPEQMKGHTAEDLYRAANKACPSLIRTEADELTYSLHIIIRYELEKGLLNGEITTAELPEKWNRLYKEYLGIDVPSDKQGVLQDSHWSGGAMGYFPSYALGSAYGAQIIDKMKETVDVSKCVSDGDFTDINNWLGDNIWQYGSLYTPSELLEKALGKPFDVKYYAEYLENKFGELYGI